MSDMDGGSVFADDPQEEKFPCPNCGEALALGTPICGNCGTVLQHGTAVPPPLAASGIRPGSFLPLLLVIAIVVAGFLGRERIEDFFGSVEDAVEDVPAGGGPGQVGVVDGDRIEVAYRNIGALVRDLRAGGVPCTNMTVDHQDEILSSGSCQSNGMHVQITLYYERNGLEFAKDFYAKFAFASVHDANWWVSGDTALMRRVKRALGGRLHVPS